MRHLFIFIILSCTLHAALSGVCEHLLAQLADHQGQFINCNTHHALPVKGERLCEGCRYQYLDMKDGYETLMKTENCSQKYTDSDRINIVATTQGVLEGLWKRAYCEDCFNGNNSVNFSELYMQLKQCLDDPAHRKKECTDCVLEYVKLNDFYTNLDKMSKGHVCFDMQDLMNSTRVLWSKDLKCCQRKVQLTLFLISVGLVAVLPIFLFYSTAFVLTKRREANHGLLNEQEPELDAPSTSNLITAAVLSTPTLPPAVVDARIEKIAQLVMNRNDVDSSTDDEPMILKPKTN